MTVPFPFAILSFKKEAIGLYIIGHGAYSLSNLDRVSQTYVPDGHHLRRSLSEEPLHDLKKAKYASVILMDALCYFIVVQIKKSMFYESFESLSIYS